MSLLIAFRPMERGHEKKQSVMQFDNDGKDATRKSNSVNSALSPLSNQISVK